MVRRVAILPALLVTACLWGAGSPPDLVIMGEEVELALAPHSFCWNNFDRGSSTGACADGLPADPLPHIGRVNGQIEVEWPLADWTFEAALVNPDDLGQETIVGLVDGGGGVWVLEPHLGGGLFQIGLSGYGPQGSVQVTFLADIMS